MAYNKENKPVNLEKEINLLNYRFFEATKQLGTKNNKGTELYEYQVEFSYKINKLKYAPAYILSKIIYNIHQFIADINEQPELE